MVIVINVQTLITDSSAFFIIFTLNLLLLVVEDSNIPEIFKNSETSIQINYPKKYSKNVQTMNYSTVTFL